ncbi:hypothetical protein JTE90_023931 [Oedothorax gibbosus]|uniref:Uncharacterized protein n=1 Tax=Oedothorax gibbosus TaxID=931172 RepID=A0AAV6UTG6_9ARAC|nr:hypothetical protein JTE90_023931 [Oedothorax gibbosus]
MLRTSGEDTMLRTPEKKSGNKLRCSPKTLKTPPSHPVSPISRGKEMRAREEIAGHENAFRGQIRPHKNVSS